MSIALLRVGACAAFLQVSLMSARGVNNGRLGPQQDRVATLFSNGSPECNLSHPRATYM